MRALFLGRLQVGVVGAASLDSTEIDIAARAHGELAGGGVSRTATGQRRAEVGDVCAGGDGQVLAGGNAALVRQGGIAAAGLAVVIALGGGERFVASFSSGGG